jgi:hypothetical protein
MIARNPIPLPFEHRSGERFFAVTHDSSLKKSIRAHPEDSHAARKTQSRSLSRRVIFDRR